MNISLAVTAIAVLTTTALGGEPVTQVPLLGWHSIPEGELSRERFQEMAEMGLTHSLMHYSPAGNVRALEFAAQAGVKLFVGDGRFAAPGETLREAVRAYRDYPALAGYLLRDEPSVAAFASLAASRDALEAVDPAHWSYVNLFPTYATPAQLGCPTYPEHVRRFLVDFRPAVLSFDHYPILEGNRLRSDFYQNLEWIRQASLESGTPFWAFALTCPHRPYPMPTLGHIRLQAWSNFAYGAKGLQYFTYWTPTPGTWDFHDAPIRVDGTRSPTYELLKALNQDVQACAEVILRGRVAGVYHSDPVPVGARGIDRSSPFSAIEGGEAVVALHLLPNGNRYALVVHRSVTAEATLKLALQEWVGSLTWEIKVKGVDLLGVVDRKVTLRLEPGAAAFFRLEEAAGGRP